MGKFKKAEKVSLMVAIIPAIILAVAGIIGSVFSYRAATESAEAKQTPIIQEQIVTQIVTQIVEVSPTPIPPNIVLLDDFSELRNDGLGLQFSNQEGLVTNLSGGHYVAQINANDYVRFVNLIPPHKLRNFDLSLKIAESQGEVYLALYFRNRPNLTKGALGVFPSGERKGEFIVYDGTQELAHDNVTFVDLREIRITCVSSECSFYFNGAPNPAKTVVNIYDPSGDFRLGLSGDGVVRIDEIMIQELP